MHYIHAHLYISTSTVSPLATAGAAWATTISQFFGLSIFAVLLYRRREQFGITAALDEATTRIHGAADCAKASVLSKYSTLVKDLAWREFLTNNQRLAFRAVLLLSVRSVIIVE